jgi:hypothetical protein
MIHLEFVFTSYSKCLSINSGADWSIKIRKQKQRFKYAAKSVNQGKVHMQQKTKSEEIVRAEGKSAILQETEDRRSI